MDNVLDFCPPFDNDTFLEVCQKSTQHDIITIYIMGNMDKLPTKDKCVVPFPQKHLLAYPL